MDSFRSFYTLICCRPSWCVISGKAIEKNFIAMLITVSSFGVMAHGGQSVENDTCNLMLGEYELHMALYVPEAVRTQEFCRNAPKSDKAFISIDFISRSLRDKIVALQVYRTSKSTINGNTAIVSSPPAIHLNGTLSAPLKLSNAGRYRVDLTVMENNATTTGHFVFNVTEKESIPMDNKVLLLVFVFSVLLLYLVYRRKNTEVVDSLR